MIVSRCYSLNKQTDGLLLRQQSTPDNIFCQGLNNSGVLLLVAIKHFAISLYYIAISQPVIPSSRQTALPQFIKQSRQRLPVAQYVLSQRSQVLPALRFLRRPRCCCCGHNYTNCGLPLLIVRPLSRASWLSIRFVVAWPQLGCPASSRPPREHLRLGR